MAKNKLDYNSPYVNQRGASIWTKYVLLRSNSSTAEEAHGTVSTNYLSINNSGQKNFTWKTGYGGYNSGYYYLAAFPDIDKNPVFDGYSTSGTWAP